MNNYSKQVADIIKATEKGWNDGAKVGIISIVEYLGVKVENAYFPFGTEIVADGKDLKVSRINISVNACKGFIYNEESDSFEYDISFQGKPFYGSIPSKAALQVFDLDTGKIYWTSMLSASQEKNQETHKPKTVYEKPKLVVSNPNVNVQKSKASLSLVK